MICLNLTRIITATTNFVLNVEHHALCCCQQSAFTTQTLILLKYMNAHNSRCINKKRHAIERQRRCLHAKRAYQNLQELYSSYCSKDMEHSLQTLHNCNSINVLEHVIRTINFISSVHVYSKLHFHHKSSRSPLF